jgi:hypothetical protein
MDNKSKPEGKNSMAIQTKGKPKHCWFSRSAAGIFLGFHPASQTAQMYPIGALLTKNAGRNIRTTKGKANLP